MNFDFELMNRMMQQALSEIGPIPDPPPHVQEAMNRLLNNDPEMSTEKLFKTISGRLNPHPSDNEYSRYEIPKYLYDERAELKSNHSDNEIRAFTLGNKACEAAYNKNVGLCDEIAYKALSADPSALDAWRALTLSLFHTTEGDTMMLASREILSYFTGKFLDIARKGNGLFYKIPEGRAYLRLLGEMGHIALESDILEVGTYVFEEIVRLDIDGEYGAHQALAACYLKIIGRKKRFPNTKPERTMAHLNALLAKKFKPDDFMERWSKIFIAYEKKDPKWKQLVVREHSRETLAFKIIFGEQDVDTIPEGLPIPACSETKFDGVACNDFKLYGRRLKQAALDWPSLIVDIYKAVRKGSTQQISKYAEENTPFPPCEVNAAYKKRMQGMGHECLDSAREILRSRRYEEAIRVLTICRRAYFEFSQPDRRFYRKMPFAVISNRATAAYYLGLYNLCRIDTRFTLVIKPDHEKSYERIPKILEAFNADKLLPDARKLVETVMNKQIKKSEGDWKRLSQQAIGILSVRMIILSRLNELTEGLKQEIIQIGIDDSYGSVNIPTDVHPPLEWLTNKDIEPNIK